ncbi:MAG: hypothetical protein R2765_10755 [Ferruginibacter sp.]
MARGATVVLNEGHVSDAILYYTAQTVQGGTSIFHFIVGCYFMSCFPFSYNPLVWF